MLPHYLAKGRVLAYLEENAEENVPVMHALIFEHTPDFNTLNLPTYLLFQSPVPGKYSV